MAVELNENNLRQGLMGLVIALVEVVKDVLKHQAVRRMENGGLSEGEMERLGKALMDIDEEVESIKRDFGIAESVQAVKDGLDNAVNEILFSSKLSDGSMEGPCERTTGHHERR